jgi:hypothetical protein
LTHSVQAIDGTTNPLKDIENFMSFLVDYPHVAQWVSYHGKLSISHAGENLIEVALSDAGGVPNDGRFTGSSIDEALGNANRALPSLLAETKRLRDELVSGEIKSTEFAYICVPGWPAVRNPFYRRND